METIRVRKLNHSNLHLECSSSTAYEITDFFSFYVPGYKFMRAYRNRVWDGKIRLFNAMSGLLPAGLYSHLLKFVEQRGYEIEDVKTEYGMPDEGNSVNATELMSYINTLNLPFPIRDYQFDAVATAIHKKRAILVSPTGSGKSLIIYAFAR